MTLKKSKNKLRPLLIVVGSIALMIAGFVFIPHITIKLSNKFYKVSLKKENIDFDNMGPKIIPTPKPIAESKEVGENYGHQH